MTRKRYKPEEIVGKLRQAEGSLDPGLVVFSILPEPRQFHALFAAIADERVVEELGLVGRVDPAQRKR